MYVDIIYDMDIDRCKKYLIASIVLNYINFCIVVFYCVFAFFYTIYALQKKVTSKWVGNMYVYNSNSVWW